MELSEESIYFRGEYILFIWLLYESIATEYKIISNIRKIGVKAGCFCCIFCLAWRLFGWGPLAWIHFSLRAFIRYPFLCCLGGYLELGVKNIFGIMEYRLRSRNIAIIQLQYLWKRAIRVEFNLLMIAHAFIFRRNYQSRCFSIF